MKITSEDVKAVQRRVDITYEEAEKYLIKANGDIDLAIFIINKRKETLFSKLLKEAQRIFKELLTYYIKIERKGNIIMNMPLMFILVILFLGDIDTKIWLLVVSIGAILVSESQVSISKVKKDEEDMMVKPAMKKREQKAEEPKESKKVEKPEEEKTYNGDEKSIKDGPLNKEDAENQDKVADETSEDDDDYYEITIEK